MAATRKNRPAYSLDVGKDDSRYAYHQIHLTFEEDRLFELFDSEKPEFIINFAALAHGASWDKSWRFYETNVTALAKMVEGFTLPRLSATVDSDRQF